MEKKEKTEEIELAVSRSTQSFIGTYLDRNGLEADIEIEYEEDSDELESLSMLFWGNKSREGLSGFVSVTASRDELINIADKIFSSNERWWDHLKNPVAELNHSYKRATGENIYEEIELDIATDCYLDRNN